MKYAVYPTAVGGSRVYITLTAPELEAFQLIDVSSLSVSYGINNTVKFLPNGSIKYKKNGIYSGRTSLKLPPCGSRQVDANTLEDATPGFTLPRISGPILQRTRKMPIRSNGKNYTLHDLHLAAESIYEISKALGVNLALIDNKLYIEV